MTEQILTMARRNHEKQVNAFLASAISLGGGKVKLEEMVKAGATFEENDVKTTSGVIISTSTGTEIELSYTNKQDRAVLVGGFGFLIDATGVSIHDGVIDQLHRLLTCEIKRASGSNHEVSFAAHSYGTNKGNQAGFTDEKRYADRCEPIDVKANWSRPVDYLNPGDVISFKLSGMNGITAAESHSGDVNISGILKTMDLVKG
ncbi:hypothetical protein OAU50_02195 [Planctomycetota bacterium]|nr:hypothetical protein [Planctomycetota bacterium]